MGTENANKKRDEYKKLQLKAKEDAEKDRNDQKKQWKNVDSDVEKKYAYDRKE